ncbi:hypothetical protein ACF3NG_00805 [Aerococcaceae bacterium WGS1372]
MADENRGLSQVTQMILYVLFISTIKEIKPSGLIVSPNLVYPEHSFLIVPPNLLYPEHSGLIVPLNRLYPELSNPIVPNNAIYKIASLSRFPQNEEPPKFLS